MALSNHYYYDEEKCEFIRVEQNKFELIIYTTCLWILNGLVLGAIGLAALSSTVGTPAELALKAENETLLEQMESARESITSIESQLETISELDNELYRSLLGLDPVEPDNRLSGIGGSDPYSDFDIYSEDTRELLRWTSSKINSLQRRIVVQRASFDEIQAYYNRNRNLLRHLPAIKPVNNIILSGYGMRIHPVLNYRRMHEGVDFRAEIGTPIYATGDATVRSARREGSYGLMIVLDHDHGYETRYAHLSGFAEGIRAGTEVRRGDLIGYTGNTGMTQGPHLHYEVRIDGQSVDPLNYLIADTSPEEYQMFQQISDNNPMSMD